MSAKMSCPRIWKTLFLFLIYICILNSIIYSSKCPQCPAGSKMYSGANATITSGNALRVASMYFGANTTIKLCNALRAAGMYSGAYKTIKLCNDLRAASMYSGANTTIQLCNVLRAACMYSGANTTIQLCNESIQKFKNNLRTKTRSSSLNCG